MKQDETPSRTEICAAREKEWLMELMGNEIRGGLTRERERQTDRQTERERQTDRQTGRQTGRQTERQKERDRQTERERESVCVLFFYVFFLFCLFFFLVGSNSKREKDFEIEAER